MDWEYWMEYPRGFFHTIFAAPPCIEFSRALTTRPRDLEKADSLVLKTLEIINYFRPQYWYLETPRTGMLKDHPYMMNIPHVDIDYCQVSLWGYQKPTRVWGSENVGQLEPLLCDPSCCYNTRKGLPGRTPPPSQAWWNGDAI